MDKMITGVIYIIFFIQYCSIINLKLLLLKHFFVCILFLFKKWLLGKMRKRFLFLLRCVFIMMLMGFLLIEFCVEKKLNLLWWEEMPWKGFVFEMNWATFLGVKIRKIIEIVMKFIYDVISIDWDFFFSFYHMNYYALIFYF